MLLDLRFGVTRSAGVFDRRKVLRSAAEQFKQCRSVERFDVGRTQCQRLIDRLPANVHFRPLGVSEIAIPLLALSKTEFQAVGAREIPGRPCDWNSDFFED